MSKLPREFSAIPDPLAADDASAARLGDALVSASEAARYIAEFSAELSYMARESGLDLLAYLLDMARLEAIRALQTADKSG